MKPFSTRGKEYRSESQERLHREIPLGDLLRASCQAFS
ncbi:hypothetical protein RBWH47_03284 [Rhodopirellula baltica WH47]|uniref:Uncharacterized protein n=1 Tax=Rhodopirellula baltica WH47 TaxID=991778 RepID=F2AN71_RHOBT|nr:hypothetical protein RBWH47_03284 [Rhodopirellula baltica WH47]